MCVGLYSSNGFQDCVLDIFYGNDFSIWYCRPSLEGQAYIGGTLPPRPPCTAAPGSKHNLYVCKDWTVKRQNANNDWSRPYPHNGFAAGMLVSFFMLPVYSVPVAARLAGYTNTICAV